MLRVAAPLRLTREKKIRQTLTRTSYSSNVEAMCVVNFEELFNNSTFSLSLSIDG